VRVWEEHGTAKYAAVIAHHEMGNKKEHLRITAGGNYAKDCVLMIGDLPGGLAAVGANYILFFPANPGHKEASGQRLHREDLAKFFRYTYAGNY
jgi:hypothetical protein